jgi:hypothetical protein
MPHKHGHRRGADGGKSPTYMSWSGMRQRCLNPKHKYYKDYGGRGIRVDQRWASFKLFLEDMGPRPEGKTLNRLEGSKDYCKDNCVWSSLSEQNTNRRKWPQQKSRLTGKFIGSEDQEDAESRAQDTSFEFGGEEDV